jgi:hypothetical protein
MSTLSRKTLPVGQIMAAVFLLILLLAVTLLTTGCTFLQSNVGPTAKKLTDNYCSQPLTARLAFREEIAKAIAPATLKLVCPGDPAE